MKDLNALNQYRIECFGSKGDDKSGAFRIPIDGKVYTVIASSYAGWDHVSVSHRNRKNVPTWDVICKIKDMFFEPEEIVMQLHPKKSEYINLCENCLHLWRPITAEIPTPPRIMV